MSYSNVWNMAINCPIDHLRRLQTWDMQEGPCSPCCFPREDTPISMAASNNEMVRRYGNRRKSTGFDGYNSKYYSIIKGTNNIPLVPGPMIDLRF